jgi:hypothetical protein
MPPELTRRGPFGLARAALGDLLEPFAEIVGAALPGEDVEGPLEAALDRSSGWLVAPTRGEWVAFFGADPRPPAWELPDRIGCRTLLVYASAATVGFTLRGPGRAGPLDAIRTLIVNADEPEPQVHGDPLPFEDAAPRSLGLDPGWLARYLHELGVDAFDPGFYLPAGTRGVRLAGARAS